MRRLFPTAGEIEPADAYGRLAPVAGRAAVRLNMIASVDGATALGGRSGALGGAADKAVFAVLRSLTDAILVGAGTVRAERYGPVRLSDEAKARRAHLGLAAVPPIAVVTRSCRLDWESTMFTEPGQRPIVVTTASASTADRGRAAEVADVVVAGDADVDLGRTLTELGERGHVDLLCEGGPGIAAQLASGGLLDEVCLTVSPLLVGGASRRILDGTAFEPPPRLLVEDVLEADGYLFLHYGRGEATA